MSNASNAGRISPKPLRFVPYDPGKKKSRRSRKANGGESHGEGSAPGPAASVVSTLPLAPFSSSTILNHPKEAAVPAVLPAEEDYDGTDATPGRDDIG